MQNFHIARFNLASLVDKIPDVTDSQMFAELYGHSTRFGEVYVRDANWAEVLRQAHTSAYRRLAREGNERVAILDRLRDVTGRKIFDGEVTGSGKMFVPEINVTLQGRSADISLRNILNLAKTINCPVDLVVRLAPRAGKYGGQAVLLWWSPAADEDALSEALA